MFNLQVVGQQVAGKLLDQDKHTALIVNDFEPSQELLSNLIILRCAFVTRGHDGGDHIFPAFILDDWGREIHGIKLYRWMRENGERFPRAEIFGYEQDGRETQCFVRELELYATLPCYAFLSAEVPVSKGRRISAIFLPTASAGEVRKIGKPDGVSQPLRSARVTWWEVPGNFVDVDLAHLELGADPGY